jgi:hypothetical protein
MVGTMENVKYAYVGSMPQDIEWLLMIGHSAKIPQPEVRMDYRTLEFSRQRTRSRTKQTSM